MGDDDNVSTSFYLPHLSRMLFIITFGLETYGTSLLQDLVFEDKISWEVDISVVYTRQRMINGKPPTGHDRVSSYTVSFAKAGIPQRCHIIHNRPCNSPSRT